MSVAFGVELTNKLKKRKGKEKKESDFRVSTQSRQSDCSTHLQKRGRWIAQRPEPSDSSHNLPSDCHSGFSCDPASMSGKAGGEEKEKKLCSSNAPKSLGTTFLRFPICSNFPSSRLHGSSDCDSTAAADFLISFQTPSSPFLIKGLLHGFHGESTCV